MFFIQMFVIETQTCSHSSRSMFLAGSCSVQQLHLWTQRAKHCWTDSFCCTRKACEVPNLLIQGFVIKVQVIDHQLCSPHSDHLIFVSLLSFVVLVFSQLFSAKRRSFVTLFEFFSQHCKTIRMNSC